MTPDIAKVLAIVAASLVCFITGILRLDVVALLVLLALAVTGLVSPQQAVSGFSNPAVITIAGMFVISAALARTGVASLLGRQMHKAAAGSPQKLIAVIMLVAGVLSAFINSVGLTAMMLPVVMDLARRARLSPSKLLLPLVMGALLGSSTSLVGTPRNIVASNALAEHINPATGVAYEPFSVFSFAPVGLVILFSGVAFVALVAWKWLPDRDPHRASVGGATRDEDLVASFDLQERLFVVRIPAQSQLDGRPLAASRLGSALGLHVVAVLRPEGNIPAPGAATILKSNDRLLVEGRPDLLREIQGNRHLRLQEDGRIAERLTSAEIDLAEVRVPQGSSLVGRTLADANLRSKMHIVVLAIMRGGVPTLTGLKDATIGAGDTLLVQGTQEHLDAVTQSADFDNYRHLSVAEAIESYRIYERLVTLQVTHGSMLIGRSLGESKLADAAGLTVIAVTRENATIQMPDADLIFREDDVLVVSANPNDLRVLRALQRLEIVEDAVPDLSQLESESVGLLEVVLAPRTTLVGKTPRQLQFREKFGLSVLAIWREGRAIRSNLRDIPLKFGDSLLVFGPRAKLRVLASEPDFIGLTQAVQAEPRTKLAPIALAALAVALIPAIAHWTTISVSVLMGATLVVLTKCLTIDEAYRGIELSSVVLVAALIPLGVAMEHTGAANFLANNMIGAVGGFGPRGVLAALCIMTAIGSQAVPAPALVLLMAPIAITTAETAHLSPHALMMGVALCALGLSSPVGHPANALVMGPGGYRYSDYAKVGLPLTVIVVLIALFIMPLKFPLV